MPTLKSSDAEMSSFVKQQTLVEETLEKLLGLLVGEYHYHLAHRAIHDQEFGRCMHAVDAPVLTPM